MDNIKRIYPDFYKNFKCLAGACPDTCCRDWDVVVDDESYEFYSGVEGEFGERLRSCMKIDSEGDRIFIFENNFCPFLSRNWLCEIQMRFGEEHVCDTCREFPRISQDYTEFIEYMLSIACPEACRLVLSKTNDFKCIGDFKVKNFDNGYSVDFMNFLLKARALTADIFRTDKVKFSEQLGECIAFTEYVQELIDDEIFDINKLYCFKYTACGSEKKSRKFVFAMQKNLEVMDNNWHDFVQDSSGCVLSENEDTDEEYRRLALYYIYRYYLNAIASYDIITTVKMIYCAYAVCSAVMAKNGAENSFERRVMVIHKYSKEVEHSLENIEYMTDEFLMNPDFSSENILKTL